MFLHLNCEYILTIRLNNDCLDFYSVLSDKLGLIVGSQFVNSIEEFVVGSTKLSEETYCIQDINNI